MSTHVRTNQHVLVRWHICKKKSVLKTWWCPCTYEKWALDAYYYYYYYVDGSSCPWIICMHRKWTTTLFLYQDRQPLSIYFSLHGSWKPSSIRYTYTSAYTSYRNWNKWAERSTLNLFIAAFDLIIRNVSVPASKRKYTQLVSYSKCCLVGSSAEGIDVRIFTYV